MDYIGLTKQQIEEKLKLQNITNFVYINNLVFPKQNSVLLVTNCKIVEQTAYITLGSFFFDV